MHQNGIHHVTAIAGPAARNVEFYTRTLGLRLVKKTVNFDDPGTYHLYFGDEAGRPGSILTFFPWAHVAPGRLGVGETAETSFRVPLTSLAYWTQRLLGAGVRCEPLSERFGDRVLPLTDPDGTRLALVGVSGAQHEPAWSAGEVPAEHAVRGLHGVTLLLRQAAPTGAVLTDVLRFSENAREGSTTRYRAESTAAGAVVDIREAGDFLPARPGAGSVHHVAFRAADDAAQAGMVERLAQNHGIRTTAQKDRQYFRSVYFREPGGVLFEIATDEPGFAVDEPLSELGTSVMLPPFLQPQRDGIEAGLPPLG